eukprot:6182420-Pleurochrysis_carterae.AAC.8
MRVSTLGDSPFNWHSHVTRGTSLEVHHSRYITRERSHRARSLEVHHGVRRDGQSAAARGICPRAEHRGYERVLFSQRLEGVGGGREASPELAVDVVSAHVVLERMLFVVALFGPDRRVRLGLCLLAVT